MNSFAEHIKEKPASLDFILDDRGSNLCRVFLSFFRFTFKKSLV